MSGNAGRERAERFWQAWEQGDPAGLSPEDRALFALAQQMAQGTPPPRAHWERLWEQLVVRWRATQRRRWMMRQMATLRRGLTVAAGLLLLVWVLQWAITRLRPQSAPATAVVPAATKSTAPRLAPSVCPTGMPPVDGNLAPSSAATLGGGSVQVGDFWFTLLAYCDPALQPGTDSAVGGLGVWVQWDYTGAPFDGFIYEWWGPEHGERDTAMLDATLSLPTPVSHWGGWRLSADAVDFAQPQITLTFVERLDTPRGEFGARMSLTLRRGASGWLVDNVAVEPLQPAPTSTPLGAGPTPALSTYVVQPGDTCASVALKFDVPLGTLVQLNGLNAACDLWEGMTLLVPQPTPTPEAAEAGTTYTVQLGDTCRSIAWMFHVPLAALLQANDLPASCPLGMGQVLTVPPSLWASVAPARLGPNATPEQIRAKVLAPSWEAVWLAGTQTTWTNGEAQTVYGQGYFTVQGEGWVLLSTPFAATGDVPQRPEPSFFWGSQETTAGHHPLPGVHPFLEAAYPLALDDPGISPVPRFEAVTAGRMALVVDWGPNRLWIDEDTGLILRWEHYRAGLPPDGDLDSQTEYLTVVYDPATPPEPATQFATPPEPSHGDLSAAWLRFESTLIGEDPGEGDLAARLYADDAYLGALDFGQPANLGCDRSPDGTRLAWLDHDPALGVLLAWAPLAQPAQAQVGFDWPHPLSPPSWAPDGRRVAYAGCQAESCGLVVVGVDTGQVRWLHDLADDTAPPLWSPDGASLAVLHGTDSGLEVVVARVADGAVIYRGAFDADAWQPAPDSLLAAWDRNFPREVSSFSRCTAPPMAWRAASPPADLAGQPLRFSVHTNAGFHDNSVLAEVSMADGQRLGVLDLGGTENTFCRRSPDGLRLAYAHFPNAANAQVSVIRLADLRDLAHPRDLAYAYVPFLAFSPDGGRLAVLGSRSQTTAAGVVSVFDATTGALLWESIPLPNGDFPLSLVWRPDGNALAVVGNRFKSPYVWVLDASDGTLLMDEALTERYQPQPGSPLADWGVVFPLNVSWGVNACEPP